VRSTHLARKISWEGCHAIVKLLILTFQLPMCLLCVGVGSWIRDNRI
jgi:hypothetical protein